MKSQFIYYGIEKIIDGSHLPPTTGTDLQYWLEMEQLFEAHFIVNLPPVLYQVISLKSSLREKWLAILQRKSHTDPFRHMQDLLAIKFEEKDTVDTFLARLQNIWNELESHGQAFDEARKIDLLMAKMEPIFPDETRNLRRNRDLRKLTWDYVVEAYLEAEPLRPKIQSSTSALHVDSTQKSKSRQSHQSRNKSHSHTRSRSRKPRNQSRSRSSSGSSSRSRSPSRESSQKPRSKSQGRRFNPENPCFFCHEKGHGIKNCPQIQELRELRKEVMTDKSKIKAAMTTTRSPYLDPDRLDDTEYLGHTL